ncbi:hypothetical protein [Membranihabitans maritimus]|uniref:hypothetical protein n=1 Tax=Membranihabitans maritimus TaxID=2904244 RepID=UPI001F292DB9|nr:hypothetical protein [Membranihabitans maritimus]
MLDWDNHKKISTEDLVELISWRGDEDPEVQENSKRAGAIFFDRFRDKVIQKCEVLCKRWSQPLMVAEELVEETFSKFFTRQKFDINKSLSDDYDVAVELYLYRISFNALVDRYRRSVSKYASKYTGEEDLVYDITDLDIFNGTVESSTKLKEKLWLLERALDSCNWKQRLIYLTYMNAGVAESEYPPRHLSKKLRDVTGLTQRSIRVNKKIVSDKIKLIMDIYAKKK